MRCLPRHLLSCCSARTRLMQCKREPGTTTQSLGPISKRVRPLVAKQTSEGRRTIGGLEERLDYIASVGQVVSLESRIDTSCPRHDDPFLGQHLGQGLRRPMLLYVSRAIDRGQ